MSDDNENVNNTKKNKATSRRCGACGETGYNTRTCIIRVE